MPRFRYLHQSHSENALTTPSVVYFESGNNIVVGQIAKDTAEVYPDLIVQTVKRHMGDANWLRSFHGRDYRPQDVSALILRKVVGDAEQVLGQTIEDVVITCPAYFGNVEKEATRQAGTIAGLNVRFVVPEPMAAAFAYGVDALEGQTIMVYDLGGGTFDGTLLRVPGTILSTVGDLNLGGKDWDDDLLTFFTEKFQEVTGVSDDPLPINVTRAVYTVVDRQTRVIISVVQNKHRVTGEQHVVPFDECEEIGSAEVVFKHPLPAKPQIDVTYTLDLDGILKVEAIDVTTRARAVCKFTSEALLSADELAELRKKVMAVEVS